MKRINWNTVGILAMGLAIVMAAIIIALAIPTSSHAAGDEILTFKADTMVESLDKNGNVYTRFIIPRKTSFSGIEYTYGVPAMAFGAQHVKAKSIKQGSNVKAIVSYRKMNDGRESYTIRKFLE